MIILFKLFGRTRSLAVYEHDFVWDRIVYVKFYKENKAGRYLILSLETAENGEGIQFRVSRNGTSQGWRIRGPVEHWETAF